MGRADPHSILLMAFGQSNADVHPAGLRIFPQHSCNMPLFAPDDGSGIRGLIGCERQAPIDGFVPATDVPGGEKQQTILAAAAGRLYLERKNSGLERVIMRSEARGGRPLLGWQNGEKTAEGIYRNADGKRSRIYRNFVETIVQIIRAARDPGPAVRKVYVLWLHGEADRTTLRDQYAACLNEMIDDAETRLSSLNVPVEWVFVQSGGTGIAGYGNQWPGRLAVFDVARSRENADVIIAGYGYPLVDKIHYSAQGKLLLGENTGRIIARKENGETPVLPQVQSAQLHGAKLILTFHSDAALIIDETALPPPDKLNGFWAGDRRGTKPVAVRITGPQAVEITLNQAPECESLMVSYAYKTNPKNATPVATDFPVGRGGFAAQGRILRGSTRGLCFTIGPPGFP